MTNSRQKKQNAEKKLQEEKQLPNGVKVIRQFGEEWDIIASYVPSKNAKQCMQKFKNSQRSAKKGNWTQSEDRILLEWVDDHGATKWTECSKLIKGRCGKQCRERWVNILNPHVKKGNWSTEEQELIFQSLSVHFTSWSSISKLLKGRTENSIKNYFYSSVRRLKTNPIINVIKDLYITHKKSLDDIEEIRQQYQGEISKFNILTQRMCEFLLDPNPQEENFFQFLISVLLDQKSAQIFKNRKNQNKIFDQSQNSMKQNVMIPKENRSIPQTPIQQKENSNKRQLQQYIFSALNEIKGDKLYSDKQNIIQMIKYLEMQLIDNTARTTSVNNKIEIRIPCCWNCMVNPCATHDQKNQELSDFFQFQQLMSQIKFFYKIMMTFKVITITILFINTSLFRILVKNKKTQQQIKKSIREGGIELEIGAFPCYAEPENFESTCFVDNYGQQQLSSNCISKNSMYRFGFEDGARWQLGYDVTQLIKSDILWSKIQSKYNQVGGQEKTNYDYEFRTIGPNNLQTLQSSIKAFKKFYDPFYQSFKEQQYKMQEIPVFLYNDVPICIKYKEQELGMFIKPQFTFSIPLAELRDVIKDFPFESKSPLYKNLKKQYGGQIQSNNQDEQVLLQNSTMSNIFNRMNDIDLGPLMAQDNTGVLSYLNIFKNLFLYNPTSNDQIEIEIRNDIVQKSGYNNLKYFLPFLPRNSEVSYLSNNEIDKQIVDYVFHYYKQEGQRIIPHYIQFKNQKYKDNYLLALQKFLETLSNKKPNEKFYRAVLNRKKAFLQRQDINKYDYSFFEYLLDLQIVKQDKNILKKCQKKFLMNCLYRKYEEDEEFGYELLIPTTVVQTSYDRVVLELRMMPVIKDNNIEQAFQPFFDYIFNQI